MSVPVAVAVAVAVAVNVNVGGGTVIVAVHLNGNDPVSVVEGQKVAQGGKSLISTGMQQYFASILDGPGSGSQLRSAGIRLIHAVVGRESPTGR